MNELHARRGMALVAVLAVVSLIAILAVATLSVTTRLYQGSTIAARDARLETAASYASATALLEWRQRGFSSLTVGTSRRLDLDVPGTPVAALVTVTRLGAELFWIVGEAVAIDGSRRRENLIARLSIPRADTVPAIVAGGDVTLSRSFTLVADSVPGCAPSAADLRMAPAALLASVDGPLPPLAIERDAIGADSIHLLNIGELSLATLASTADVILSGGTSTATPSGVVHAMGDLTLTGGEGQGILIVDGLLRVSGPISFFGVIVARQGMLTTAPGAQLKGIIRVGPVGGGGESLRIAQLLTIRASACAAQAALNAAVIPRLVSGRKWAEVY